MNLNNPTPIGMHLKANASDHYITSADQIKDENREEGAGQTVQKTLDDLVEKTNFEYVTKEQIDELFVDCSTNHDF